MIFHPENTPLPDHYLRNSDNRLIRVILMPKKIPDPVSPHRQLIDVYNERNFTFERFCDEVSI